MTERATKRLAELPGFESPFPVAVSQVGRKEWELTSPLRFRTLNGRQFTVPVGQTTDFASIPNFLTWLVPSTTGIAAAVLHDALWRSRVTLGSIHGKTVTYRDADNILYEALRSLGVSRVRAGCMWAGVRWGVLTRPGGRRGWWRDAPAVLAISLPMLVLVSPALLLLPPWGVVWLAEKMLG